MQAEVNRITQIRNDQGIRSLSPAGNAVSPARKSTYPPSWLGDGDGDTFLVDVQADEVDKVAHECLVPFLFINGADSFSFV